MCQTTIISHSIGLIGRKSFDRHMRVVSPLFHERRGEISRLCNSLYHLCEMLHTDFPTITKDDYAIFGPELRVLINTLKALYADSKKKQEIKEGNERLRCYIEDLEELNHDILQYRVRLHNSPEMIQAMSAIGRLDFSHYVK